MMLLLGYLKLAEIRLNLFQKIHLTQLLHKNNYVWLKFQLHLLKFLPRKVVLHLFADSDRRFEQRLQVFCLMRLLA